MDFENQNNQEVKKEDESRWTGDNLFNQFTSDEKPKTKEAVDQMANDHDVNIEHLKYVVDPEVGETLYSIVGEYIESIEEGDKDKRKLASKTFASILEREFSRAMDEGRVQF